MEPYYVSVMLLTIESNRYSAAFPDVDCQHVNVRSEDVLRVCSFLIRAMRGRLAELTVSVWRGDHAEQLWQWRTLRPTPAQRKHLAELDRGRARRAAALASTCELELFEDDEHEGDVRCYYRWGPEGQGAPVWLCDHHARAQQEDLGLDLRAR